MRISGTGGIAWRLLKVKQLSSALKQGFTTENAENIQREFSWKLLRASAISAVKGKVARRSIGEGETRSAVRVVGDRPRRFPSQLTKEVGCAGEVLGRKGTAPFQRPIDQRVL